MKIITDIRAQVKDKTRCSIYLDGSFYCGLSLETVMKYRLKKGTEIEESALDEIQLDSERLKATDRALNFISSSRKTEKQIRDYLRGKGYTDATADYVADKMKEYGYIDDAAYAEEYAKSAAKKKGARLIAAELKRKGVSAADAEAAAYAAGNAETISDLARKYLKNKPIDRLTLGKCYRHLMSKGFDADDIKEALSEFYDED